MHFDTGMKFLVALTVFCWGTCALLWAYQEGGKKPDTTLPHPNEVKSGWADIWCDYANKCKIRINVPDGAGGGTVYFIEEGKLVDKRSYTVVLDGR